MFQHFWTTSPTRIPMKSLGPHSQIWNPSVETNFKGIWMIREIGIASQNLMFPKLGQRWKHTCAHGFGWQIGWRVWFRPSFTRWGASSVVGQWWMVWATLNKTISVALSKVYGERELQHTNAPLIHLVAKTWLSTSPWPIHLKWH